MGDERSAVRRHVVTSVARSVLPSLVELDDRQTDESARSLSQFATRNGNVSFTRLSSVHSAYKVATNTQPKSYHMPSWAVAIGKDCRRRNAIKYVRRRDVQVLRSRNIRCGASFLSPRARTDALACKQSF